MVNETSVQKILEAALETGGDFAELFVEDTETNRIDMTDGEVESASYKRTRGAGVRVLYKNRSAYAFTADLSLNSLLETARAAAVILEEEQRTNAPALYPKKDYSIKLSRPFSTVMNSERVELLKRGTKAAKAYSNEVTQVTATELDVDRKIAIYNSNGLFVTDRQPRTRVMFNSVATKDGEAQTGYEAPGKAMDFNAFKHIDVEGAGRQSAKTAVTMLHGELCPAAVVPVVIDGGFGGVILHEACVHALEATSVAKGNSVFCDKLGQKIASDIVTAVDDGTLENEWGSIRVDDEGTPGQRNVLVENGILKSYLVDMLGARTMNHPLTGSSRRQDYTFAPTSRMTNTFFAPGNDDEDEMLRTMGEGLYAAKMGGGSVNPLTGEFNFAVLEGYWVRDGKILCPVRGATLIGRGADILMRIDRIGRNLSLGQGMCGSLSGSVPTNVGQPRIRVSELTVGGKGGKL